MVIIESKNILIRSTKTLNTNLHLVGLSQLPNKNYMSPFLVFHMHPTWHRSWDSIVSIATTYELDNRGIEV
jgi:hypothetical protein